MRAAQRLRSGIGQGFALVAAEGVLVNVCWIADFDGFEMSELNRKLQTPSPDAVMIFDGWTPRSVRGHGYLPVTLTLLADQLHSSGKTAWGFVAATNLASIRGLQKAGYVHRFTLGRNRFLGVSRTTDSPSSVNQHPVGDVVSAR
jgi:hypothetical protein